MLVLPLGVDEGDFQLKLLLVVEHGLDDLITDGRGGVRATVDQFFPGAFARIHVQQVQCHLIDFSDA